MTHATHPYLAGEAPRVFAHRGLVTAELAARGVAENTMASFEAAARAGSTYLESDCHLTRDGVVVLFHDEDLRRVTGDPRRVSEVTFAELEALMADRGGLTTLGELLAGFSGARFNIDVKARAAAEAAGALIGPYGDRVLLTSFDDQTRLLALAAAESAGVRPATSPGRSGILRAMLAVTSGSRVMQRRVLRGLDALQVPERHRGVKVLSGRMIEAAHDAGVEVHVWTVNDVADMRRLIDLGADGIITDRADLALGILQ